MRKDFDVAAVSNQPPFSGLIIELLRVRLDVFESTHNSKMMEVSLLSAKNLVRRLLLQRRVRPPVCQGRRGDHQLSPQKLRQAGIGENAPHYSRQSPAIALWCPYLLRGVGGGELVPNTCLETAGRIVFSGILSAFVCSKALKTASARDYDLLLKQHRRNEHRIWP